MTDSGARQLRDRKISDFRWLIAVAVLGYVALVAGAVTLSGTSRPLLQGLGVPALEYPLMDLRGVAAWCDAWSKGRDPAVVATWVKLPRGEMHPNFLMNYSPLVLGFGKIGLSERSISAWGIALGLIYGFSVWVLCGPCPLRESLLWALLICSPASVLVVERGNLDELVFGLLILALTLRKYPWAESGVILGAALGKFFPIACLAAPWMEKTQEEKGRQGRVSVILAVLLFALFLMIMHSRIASISGSLHGQCQTAFGSTVAGDLLAQYGYLKNRNPEVIRMLLRLCAIAGIAGSFVYGSLLSDQRGLRPISGSAWHGFFLTAPMMLGLFMQGSQMDYKWIFFLPMVPTVLEIVRSPCEVESVSAKSWITAMTAYSFWTFFSDESSLRNALLKQLLMWGVMMLSAFLVGRVWNRRFS